jgi:asparagine synthase (glutamine-hydrolysing)
MCGIVGFTHSRSVPDDDLIRRATSVLAHRGPDQQGIHCSPGVCLGAVRLKIIDLAHGAQPMLSADGGTVIVFNGEIYNHAALRDQLSAIGHVFESRSDTEVVLHAFLEWDVECFTRLRGMFAVAVWNESRRRLVLARDRVGIKPLYYYRHGRELLFASELKGILEHPAVPRTVDPEGLNHYLSLNYVPCPYTLVRDVRKLPPGHWMEWVDGELRTGEYWRLSVRERSGWTLDRAKEALDHALQESVREHLISDVPVGVWLSGGLDSSTILHYASQCSSTRLRTFSVSFRGRSCDETRYFREVAAAYGSEHTELDLNADLDVADALGDMAYYSDEPSADAGALPLWYLSRMSRESVTVALSGDGADEILGGYVTYRADRLARLLRLVPRALRRRALELVRRWPPSDDKVALEYKVKRFLEGSFLTPDEAHSYWNGCFSAEQKRRLMGIAGDEGVESLYERHPPGLNGWPDRYLWFDQAYYLPDDILYKCDRMSMAHSLEVRPPFLDHRVVELANSFPAELKIRGREHKRVLRELMKGRLPQCVLNRPKEGFDIPAHEWLRGALRPFLLDTLAPDSLERMGIRWPKGLQQLVDGHLERRINCGYQLWGLLVLVLWAKRWGISFEGHALGAMPGVDGAAQALTAAVAGD